MRLRGQIGHNGAPSLDDDKPDLARRAILGGAAALLAASTAHATAHVTPAFLFYGHTTHAHYAAPATSVDSAAAISTLFTTNVVVELDTAGAYWSNNSFSVPPNRRLICNNSTLKLRSTSTATNVITNFGTVEDAILDANMTARVAAGYAQFCHGGLIRNAQRAGFKRCTVNDAGDAIANGYAGLSAVGIYIDRDTAAVFDTLDCYAEDCVINDPTYILPFGMRIASSFINFAAGEQGFYNRNTRFQRCTINGTFKNLLECVGPDTVNFSVLDSVGNAPSGQGGMEADFGANNGAFRRNLINGCGINGTLVKTFSAYNARTSDKGDGKLKQTHDIIMDSNRLTGGIIRNSFHIYAREDAGSLRTQWINHRMDNMTVESGSGSIVGHSFDTSVFACVGMTDTGADISTATVAMKLYGALGATNLTWSAGNYASTDRGFWNSSSAPLVNVKLGTGLNLTAAGVLIDAKGPFQVDGATLSGASITLSATPADLSLINTTLTLPAAAMTALTTAVPAISNPASNNTLIAV